MRGSDFRLRLRALFRHGHAERELQEEVEFHQAMAARRGRGAAEFGSTDRVLEECRDARGLRWLEDLGRDLRFAARRFRHAPGFAAVAVLTLALGIGANTALFTLVHAVLLARLPVPHPEQLALLGNPGFTGVESGVSDHAVDGLTYAQYQQLRAQDAAFRGLAAFSAFEPSFRLDWGAFTDEIMPAKLVSDNYFQVLGLTPARGRFFDSATAPEAVLSYGYWQQRFGGDATVVGRTFHLRAATFTIVGIAPRGFDGTTVGQSPALYLPLELQPQILTGRDWRPDPPGIRRVVWLLGIGRLQPGVSLAQAQAASGVIFAESVRAQAEHADASSKADILTQRLAVTPAASGASSLRDSFTRPLLSLQVLVGLVLLIVIVNLGGMLLSQASAREREFAMRLSLGASRGRLVRQLLTESLVLAAAGGAAGWFLAQWGERVLVGWVAAGDATLALPYHFDPAVLAFTAGVCVLAGLAFGLAPALRLARGSLAQRSGRNRAAALPGGLVVAQVALALVLVTGAALFVRSLEQLRSVPLGYSAEGLVTFNLNASMAGASAARAMDLYRGVSERLRQWPGVNAVTYSANGLFTGQESGDGMVIPGYTKDDAAANLDAVAPGYFAALGIPVLLGREFTPADRSRGMKPIVIDEALAKKYFAGRNPLGTMITVRFSDGSLPFEVVGVTAPAKQRDPRESATDPRAYFDIENGHEPGGMNSVNFELRTRAGAGLSRDAVNRLIAAATGLPLRVNSFTTVEALLDTTIAPDLLLAKLAGFFALLALGLAAMGLYAMLSYGVARRRAEIGIRMALGARARQVTVAVMGEALRLLVLGTALGAAASLALGRSLASLLFELRPSDPASLALAASGLLLCGLAAALVPALRAARTDPARTLRAE
ncbi:MAG TPA: ADOP family duplicated permease [Terriglobales bacterium]|nr:ADOP family duplicated permease [Terriglobales bacterium]